MNVLAVSGPADRVGAERQQVERAEIRVVADLREARADVLVGAGHVGQRRRPDLPLIGGRGGELELRARSAGAAPLDAGDDRDVAARVRRGERRAQLGVVVDRREGEIEVAVRRGVELDLDARLRALGTLKTTRDEHEPAVTVACRSWMSM